MAPVLTRRRKFIGHRRRVEDEGEDDNSPEALDLLDDDTLSEGSSGSEDNDAGDDSDTSNIDEASPTSANARKSGGNGTAKAGSRKRPDGQPKHGSSSKFAQTATMDTDLMLNGLTITDGAAPVDEINFDDVHDELAKSAAAAAVGADAPVTVHAAPIVVSSASASQPQAPHEVRRREHEEYRRKRDEDPAFVPNRGAFFMHDHRHAGPAANGFRPFGRGGGRGGRGGARGGFGGGLYAPVNHMHNPSDPTTNAPWAHDMHEAVADPMPSRRRGSMARDEGPPNGNGIIPTLPPSSTPINRTMATEKLLGSVQVRVFFPPMASQVLFPGMPVKQYTKLPDHRPPLRRDKPVRISLPDYPPRYIFPAVDRSFTFIPRAMRPNQQQRLRGKTRSVFGSVGGFSRRTSVFGGSYYQGSTYSPSIAMSRRSSIAPDMGRDFLISPTGSAISRPPLPLPLDNTRPVVRLPPQAAPPVHPLPDGEAFPLAERPLAAGESSISDIPQPQTHPLPQKPDFQENRTSQIPMHQPRPQKTLSLENIESPVQTHDPVPPYQQAFHQQVPMHVANGYPQETHVRHPSYPSQHSTGTPLSQIPERAIHAAPFQPNAYPQPGFYGQPYPAMQPQPGYYYPPAYPAAMAPSAAAAPFVPGVQPGQPANYAQPPQADAGQGGAQNLVAQEVNGMVYYYDASQLPPVSGFPSYPAAQYAPGVVGMGGMMTPSPDGFYYPQPAPGMVYYSQ